MSDMINAAVEALGAKMNGGFDGVAKFVIEGEGAIMFDSNGVHAGDEGADVTLTASSEVFKAILDGEQNPTAAYMSGNLKLDGDMGAAMKLAAILG